MPPAKSPSLRQACSSFPSCEYSAFFLTSTSPSLPSVTLLHCRAKVFVHCSHVAWAHETFLRLHLLHLALLTQSVSGSSGMHSRSLSLLSSCEKSPTVPASSSVSFFFSKHQPLFFSSRKKQKKNNPPPPPPKMPAARTRRATRSASVATTASAPKAKPAGNPIVVPQKDYNRVRALLLAAAANVWARRGASDAQPNALLASQLAAMVSFVPALLPFSRSTFPPSSFLHIALVLLASWGFPGSLTFPFPVSSKTAT